MVTWLYISFDEFLKYALSIEAVTDEQLNTYKAESLTLFQNLMIAQAERIGEMDDISRYFKGLRYLLDTKEARLGYLQSRNVGYSTGDSKSAIGFIKKGRVYLKNNTAFQQVVAYHRKYDSEFAISETTLRRMLADNDHLVPKSAKNFVHRLHVNQENYQCIVFEEAVFNALLKGGATDGSEDDSEIPGDRGLRQNADNYLGRSD